MRWTRHLAAMFALTCAYGSAHSQAANRVIDDVDISVHSGYTDISILYACGLRYMNHLPSSEGDRVRIRTVPQLDCNLRGEGIAAPTLPGVVRNLIAAMDVDRPVSNEVDITIRWRRSERFLVMPTADGRGLRIRVLRAADAGSRVIVGADLGAPTARYAINLESSRTPFSVETIEAAKKSTSLQVYVSQLTIDDEQWFRLRAGPIVTESDAKLALLNVRTQFPKAWLAIGDDETLNSYAANPVTAASAPREIATTTLTAADTAVLLKQAKTSFRKKDYETAIPLLTKLLAQAEFPERAEAQELIGLARERSRQIAHAKAEYEEYLRRYPNGPAANRVQQRLQALALAARKAVRGLSSADESDSPWKVYGGFSQLYRRDNNQLENSVVTSQATSQNVLLNDFSLIARRRGERFDFSSRVSAAYAKNFLDNGLGDQTRVSTAFVELTDRQWNWRSRLGRQSVSGSGVFGTFDGAYAEYQWRPRWRFSLSAGSPVDSTRSSYDGDRQFASLAVNFGPFASAWDVAAYTVMQQFDGQVDRRAIGTEVHYFQPGRTVIGLVDYDLYYGELNNVMLLGTFDLPSRWTLNVNADRRVSPALSVRNALIGQPTASLDDLLAQFTREEIDQLVRDRASLTQLYGASLSRPLGERWLWTVDVSSIGVGGTAESGGVEAIPDAPRELAYSTLAIGNGVFASSDLAVLALRYQSGGAVEITSLGLSSRWPLWGTWRVTPRIRIDKQVFVADGAQQWLYAPSLRLDYQLKKVWFELELGTELGKRDVGESTENTTRNYLSVVYRYNF